MVGFEKIRSGWEWEEILIGKKEYGLKKWDLRGERKLVNENKIKIYREILGVNLFSLIFIITIIMASHPRVHFIFKKIFFCY